ncbi:hypothetical protein P152DRAFT_295329 [Eremomyces bilateralis CBS 781.70]|uniref:Uncharacterized protein n=1 Tax=Eremomyces bilateralis CBS 781.70 TaxID=1392243 RepID=A0A6G1G7K8_9PEZI|nr:uncharacterized protein P152DRAFT_295329 [Eremomyces bilateralis CBS 781.70]KAF1813870.1 hypothetical protein P152DRAFT_295329 [Eremomyces bilateralis CBS 781.70]
MGSISAEPAAITGFSIGNIVDRIRIDSGTRDIVLAKLTDDACTTPKATFNFIGSRGPGISGIQDVVVAASGRCVTFRCGIHSKAYLMNCQNAASFADVGSRYWKEFQTDRSSLPRKDAARGTFVSAHCYRRYAFSPREDGSRPCLTSMQRSPATNKELKGQYIPNPDPAIQFQLDRLVVCRIRTSTAALSMTSRRPRTIHG